jgi:hypothetical protein
MITLSILRASFLLLAVISSIGLTQARADDASKQQAKFNGGYFLLHQLGNDEAQVPLLLDVKHAPAEITTFADKISKVGKKTVASLEHLQETDHAIQLDRNPLPSIERDTRDSIKADKQHQLLFGTTDSEFVRAFLVSQIEASTYALNLSKVLAEQETDQGRIKTLQHLSAQWLDLRNEAFRILRNY